MKGKILKIGLCSAMALGIVAPNTFQLHANEVNLKDGLKDHWNFDTLTSVEGTTATKHGNVEIADSGNKVFGKVLRFGNGTGNYMKLSNYINTGKDNTSFSMWYRYDTKIQGDDASKNTVLLQHEGDGKSLLTLKADGHYNTYVNAQNVDSNKTVTKGDWQHITVSFNQTTKKVKFFINGKFDSEKPLGNTTVNKTLSLRLGSHKNDNSTDPHPMRGDVDEFYVYNKALNNDEAKALYEVKAKELYKDDLQKLITEGEQLLNNDKLDKTAPEVIGLIEKLENAKKALTAQTLDQMKTVYDELENVISACKGLIPVQLTINKDGVERTIDTKSIFGINHRYAFNGYGTFDSQTMKMKEEFTKLYEDAGFGSIRYPGGTISNLFNWKTTIGPKADRKKQIHGFYNNREQGGIEPNFGLEEVGNFADSVNSEIVYVYSLGRGNAQDAADLVEYLNAEVGTNPNGGVDWAAVRAKNGHKAPYNVRYFEIGNEMQQAFGIGADGTSSQGYWTDYVSGGAEKAYTEGGTATFTKQYAVAEEDWNKVASQTTGKPNMVRYARYANTNPGKLDENGKIVVDPNFKALEPGVKVFVGVDSSTMEWKVVENFEHSSPEDRHVVVDYATGAIKFGDGKHGRVPDANQNVYVSYQVKRQGFIDVSKAIKQTMDKINAKEGTSREANVYTSFESAGFITRMNNLKANDWYDGMTIHPYSDTVSGGNNAELFYDNAMKRAEVAGIGKVQNYVKMLPKGKVPVISEYGIFRNTERQVRSQTHAIYIAKVLMEYVRLGSPYIQKHCLADWYSDGGDSLGPTQQAVIQVVKQDGANTTTGEGNFAFFSTPSAHVFKMLNSGFGEDILSVTMDRQPTMKNGVKSLSTLVSQDSEGNIYAAMVNVERKHAQKVMLDIPNYDIEGRTIEIQTLSSDSITSENSLTDPNKVDVQTSTIVAEKNQVITLPKHSFVKIKIVNKIDKSNLQNKVDEIASLNKDHYTNYDSITNAYNHANEVLNDKFASVKDVKNAFDALVKAQNDLVLKKADYSKVNAAIEKANSLNKDEYKDFSKVEEAMNAVVKDKDITKQAEVDAMADAIENAIAKLEKKEVVNKDALEAAISKKPAKEENAYTKASWEAYQEALKKAEEVNANANATQKDVDAAKDALLEAMQGLKENPALTPLDPSTTVKPEVKPTPEQKPEVPTKPNSDNNTDKVDNAETPNTASSTNLMLLWIVLLASGTFMLRLGSKKENM